MTRITVVKLDHAGAEKWRYEGEMLERNPHQIILQAFFDREDYLVHDLLLKRGDRFIETYFDDRWYNFYEIFDRESGGRKAWYGNVGFPATFEDNLVSYQDLALDLLVFPDGRQIILDEDEFIALNLPGEIRNQARQALVQLQSIFQDAEERTV